MSIHIGAAKGEIADTVLLPGDPLRAKFIAEQFLDDVKCYNNVRNMFGYTGKYQGQSISVQGAGMGIPSTAIYVNELIDHYDVKTLIRVGTCGALIEDFKIGEIMLAMGANTDSSINRIKFKGMDYAPTADFGLLNAAYHNAQKMDLPVRVGGIFSTDSFYDDDPDRYKVWANHGVIGVEMESTVLYTLAAAAGARALSILSVSDNLVTGEMATAEQREQEVEEMTKLALSIV